MKISLLLTAGTHKRWVCSSNPGILMMLFCCFPLLGRGPFPTLANLLQVKFEQGVQILKIFKNHSSKTTILDDFGFYEARQKTMQEKKAKQLLFQKQARILLHFLSHTKKFYLHFNCCLNHCPALEHIIIICRLFIYDWDLNMLIEC